MCASVGMVVTTYHYLDYFSFMEDLQAQPLPSFGCRYINRAYGSGGGVPFGGDGFTEVLATSQSPTTAQWSRGTADAVRQVGRGMPTMCPVLPHEASHAIGMRLFGPGDDPWVREEPVGMVIGLAHVSRACTW